MALDHGTILALDWLAQKWETSKAGVIRRAVQEARKQEELEQRKPNPLDALDWLQNTGGHTQEEASMIKEEIAAERQATRYWWES